jgi:hypothetical protein
MNLEKLISSIPDKNSSDQYWIQWHDTLKKQFGKEKANQAFIVAFAYRAGSSAKTKDLFRYGQSQGLDLETNLIGDAGRIIEGVKEKVSGITGKIGRILQTSKIIVVVLIILILIPVFMFIYKIAKEPTEVIQAASAGFAASKGIR